MRWTHDALAEDLAAHLRAGGERLTWCNIDIPGAGGARPDVLAMKLWGYANPQLVTYEVKASVSDFRSDVTAGKWQKYLQFSQGVTFAAPHGMLSAKDVPDSCGLILRSERGWRHVRKPTLKPAEDIATAVWVKLVSVRPNLAAKLGYGSEEEKFQRSRTERSIEENAKRAIGKRYGEAIAQYLRAPDAAKRIVDEAKARAAEIDDHTEKRKADYERKIREMWLELGRAVGMPEDAEIYEISRAVERRSAVLSETGAAAEVMRSLVQIRKAIDDGTALLRMAAR